MPSQGAQWSSWTVIHKLGFCGQNASFLLPHFLNTEADTSSCVYSVNPPFHVSEETRHQRQVQL